MIKFIEKEPYKNYDNWNERECLMYPNNDKRRQRIFRF